MSARAVVALGCTVLAAALAVLFLVLVAHAAWTWWRWLRHPLVTARVVGHDPAPPARDRVRHARWRTVVSWPDTDGRELREALDPPAMEPGLRWLAAGDEVVVRVDAAGRVRRPGDPARALRGALLVGALYLLLPALMLGCLAAGLG